MDTLRVLKENEVAHMKDLEKDLEQIRTDAYNGGMHDAFSFVNHWLRDDRDILKKFLVGAIKHLDKCKFQVGWCARLYFDLMTEKERKKEE